MPRVLGHLHANAVAYVALFVALGGTGAWAATQIGANDIKVDAVRSKHIKVDAVKGDEVEDDSLQGSDIQEPTLDKVAFGRFGEGFYADTTEDQLAEMTGSALVVHDDGEVDTTREVIVEHTGAGGVFHVLTADSPTLTAVTPGNSVAITAFNSVLDFVVQSGHAGAGGAAISIHCGFDPDFNGATQPHVSCFSLKSSGNL